MILKKRKGSIAIVGSRGIPNNYGGFECFTENISQQLAEKGHQVYVSCEHPDSTELTENFNGVNLFYFPIKHPKSSFLGILYEVFYDMYSLYWASRRVDQVYMLGYSAAIFFFIPKLFGKKLYLNPDGFEWKRNKFNGIMKLMLKINERLGTFWADQIVADSKRIKEYFDTKYGTESSYIAYGASEMPKITWDQKKLPEKINNCQIYKNDYWLIVARLEPENNIHEMIKGYLKSNTNKPLILIGNYVSDEYQEFISKIVENKPEDKQVIFAGGIYNQENLNMLRQNCFGYMHGHSVGGTNPSLIEAMAMETLILAHANQFNQEVCEDTTLYFKDSDELKAVMDDVEYKTEDYVHLKSKALERVKKEYSWEKISSEYDQLFELKVRNKEIEDLTISKFYTPISTNSKSK